MTEHQRFGQLAALQQAMGTLHNEAFRVLTGLRAQGFAIVPALMTERREDDRAAIREAFMEIVEYENSRDVSNIAVGWLDAAMAATPLPEAAAGVHLGDEGLRAALNEAYRERNMLVAALIRVGGYPATITYAPDAHGWNIVYLDTPAGQTSWHVGPNDLDLFPETIAAWVESVEWDGHTTPEKYERLAALATSAEDSDG